MCQFSFNIKAPLFVCSSLALNLLTTRLVDLASFPNSFSRPFRLGPSLSNSRLPSFARVAPYNWLEIAGREHGFTVMQWPANSPDMNPIENLWAILKHELHQRYPDTK